MSVVAESASGPPEPGRITSWFSPTGSWSPWSTCVCSCRTRHWPSSTASPAQPSPAPSTRSARCWLSAASPSLTGPASACAPWPMSSPTPRPRVSSCASTAPRPRSAAPRPAAPAARRSYPARRSRTPPRPPPSATAWDACCGPGPTGPAECTTRPRCAPKASPSSCVCIRRSRRRSTRVTGAWPTTSPTRSRHRHASRRTKCRWARTTPGARRADGSPPRGSAWSTPSARRRSGGRSSDTSAGAIPTPKPTPPSPDWSPTARPAGPPGGTRAPNGTAL